MDDHPIVLEGGRLDVGILMPTDPTDAELRDAADWYGRALETFRDANPFTLTFHMDGQSMRRLLVIMGLRPSGKGRRPRLWIPAWTTSTGRWFTWAARPRCRTCGEGIKPGCSAHDGTGAWSHLAEVFDIDHRPRLDQRRARKTASVGWRH